MQGCAAGLSLVNFCKISGTAKCHSIAFTRKSQGAMRLELVGKHASFLLEEHFALGQRGEDMSHSILSNQQQISALRLFSCCFGDGVRGSEHSFPWPATNHLSPFIAQLNTSVMSSENISLPRGKGGGSCDAVSSLPRAGEQLCGLLCACVSHCHLVTGSRTHEPATMGQ